MPTYNYRCKICQRDFTKVVRLVDHAQPQVCPSCGVVATKLASASNFVLQGDSWPGKNIRVRQQMSDKNRRLDAKAKDMPVAPRLIPNVNGEEVGSWAEARARQADLARAS